MRPILAAVLAAAFACLPVTASAQAPCAPYAAIVERLAAEYQEAVAARGIDAAGRLVVLYANAQSGTWTALVVPPDGGLACIVSSGEGWEALEYAAPAAPAKPS